ncbi:MAG: hypothetical protein QF551_02255 [Candidatus Marinimicrobia bacterium]|nr:hypothetical protein [Candidatus Neomarinimicrobiota bacterium]
MIIWLLIVLAVALVILALYAYKVRFAKGENKHSIPFILRSITFLVLIFVLAELEISRTATLIRKPLVRVFFDNSVSASYHRAVSARSLLGGYQEIAASLKDAADRSNSDGLVQLFTFGSEVEQIEQNDLSFGFSEPTTKMDDLLEKAGLTPSDAFLQSIILVTDGQYTAGNDPRHIGADIAIPVHTIGIGELKPLVDVRIEKVNVPAVGIQNDMVKAEINVVSIGTKGERIHVTLAREKELLGTKVINLEGDGSLLTVRFQFELTKVGTFPYSIQATSVKDEVNIANNRSSFSITTLKDRFSIALISGAPSANTGFLKRVMKREPKLAVSHYVRLQKRWEPSIASFWRTNYDLIVLDNFPTGLISEKWIDDLKKKVEREKASLLFVAGPNVMKKRARLLFDALGLQVVASNFRAGKRYSMQFRPATSVSANLRFLAEQSPADNSDSMLPPVTPLLFVEPGVPGVDVLAFLEGQTQIPLVLAGEISGVKGKTRRRASFTSPDLWELYFRSINTGISESVVDFWQRIFGWLVRITGDQTAYFRFNKNKFQQGEQIVVEGSHLTEHRARERANSLQLRIFNAAGESRSYPLAYDRASALWKTSFFAGRGGKYSYEIVEPSLPDLPLQVGNFTIEESQIELNKVFLNKSLLQDLSDKTGGTFLQWDSRERIGDLVSFEKQVFSSKEKIQLSHLWPLMLIGFILLAGEWVVRRLIGLQ